MFTPKFKVKGYKTWEANLVGTAARAVDCLVASGEKLDEAARQILPLVQAKLPNVKLETIKGWRHECKKKHSAMPDTVLNRYRAPFPADLKTDPLSQALYLKHQLQHAPALRNP
jgi:hypothetical protein